MKMKSTTTHRFSEVPRAEIQRSSFDRSHGCKTTFDSGFLVPIFVDEALPGDTFTLNLSAFARIATPIKPVMDNLYMESFFFAVPNRLLWENWQRFNGEQDNPGDSTDFLIPTITNTYVSGTLGDYFGIPTLVDDIKHSALWHRAYHRIWNEWFRDENLQDSLIVPKDDGPDILTPELDALLKRGKRHDYFTSALPWPQKGPAVGLPLGTSAPVKGIGVSTADDFVVADSLVHQSNAEEVIYSRSTVGQHWLFEDANNPGFPDIYADLTQATGATINQLREAFQIQKLYERDARGGTRYTELLKSHFGVTSPDSRLQRSEYLGGGSSPINMTVVPQTTPEGGTTPQGNLAAFGTASFSGHSFSKSFTEHCTIIGMVCVRADLTYQQGLNRMFSRQTRWDFYWPALAHIGEQEILNQELYMQSEPNPQNTEVFGYQERFAEYRYKPSIITGQFRSNFAQTLDLWHLAQDFQNLPTLSSDFIEENPPIDRIVAVPSEPQFIFDSYMKLTCARPMPTYSVPGLIDHF